MSRRLILIWALLLAPLAAAEVSVVPYAALYESLRPALEVSGHDRLLARTRIQSKRRDVAPEQIRLDIRSRNGLRTVRVAPNGDVNFPLETTLREENPAVASNQPKGSLTLSVAIELRPPRGLRFPYREIALGIDQMRAVVTADGADGRLHVQGVELWFDPRAQAQLSVVGRIEQLRMADRNGRIVLDDRAEFREDGVMLVLTAMPREIIPVLGMGSAP
ncbi:MAG TPA: hypothetical protein VN581_15335 [Patescibacteria group bacterium]|nr:hypothetical protein [Patescibacteria group bacterium]